MLAFHVTFEMTDALVAQAVRQDCIAFGRKHLKLKDMLVIAGSAAVFFLALCLLVASKSRGTPACSPIASSRNSGDH